MSTWSNYTPVWVASGTQPVLNNGTITSRYIQQGKFVTYVGRLVAGSTTTFGTGNYSISLPVTSANFFGSNGVIGTSWLRYTVDYQGVLVDGGTTFTIRAVGSTYGANAVWTTTVPATFASGDWLSWCCTYEAA